VLVMPGGAVLLASNGLVVQTVMYRIRIEARFGSTAPNVCWQATLEERTRSGHCQRKSLVVLGTPGARLASELRVVCQCARGFSLRRNLGSVAL
jgi:hypothetical protein